MNITTAKYIINDRIIDQARPKGKIISRKTTEIPLNIPIAQQIRIMHNDKIIKDLLHYLNK